MLKKSAPGLPGTTCNCCPAKKTGLPKGSKVFLETGLVMMMRNQSASTTWGLNGITENAIPLSPD